MKNTLMMIALLTVTSATMASSFRESLAPRATKTSVSAVTAISAPAHQDQQLNTVNPALQSRSGH